jgi:RNase H-like domain found in reverse transcriptase
MAKIELQSFLGLCGYYRRFITDFSKIARPLFQLTEKKSKFIWNPDCGNAFEALKNALTKPPVLTHATETGQFILDTDASNESIGVVLSQIQDGAEKVIDYHSKTLGKAERNYCVTRKNF